MNALFAPSLAEAAATFAGAPPGFSSNKFLPPGEIPEGVKSMSISPSVVMSYCFILFLLCLVCSLDHKHFVRTNCILFVVQRVRAVLFRKVRDNIQLLCGVNKTHKAEEPRVVHFGKSNACSAKNFALFSSINNRLYRVMNTPLLFCKPRIF